MNDGFDLLGAQSFEDHLIGAATPNVQPTVSRLTAAAGRASRAAAKLQRLNPRAAAKLKAHSSTAITKSDKLKKAALKAASAVVKKSGAAAAPSSAARAATAASKGSAAPSRAAAPGRASARARAHVGLAPGLIAAMSSEWVRPMMDVYNAFANQVDDAGVAGEVISFVQPLLSQLQSSSRTDLVTSGNDLIDQANALINSVSYPEDPPVTYGGVGYSSFMGELFIAASVLQERAANWIQAARLALGVVTAVPPASAAAPAAPPAPAPGLPGAAAGPSGGGGGGGGPSGGGGSSGGGGGAPEEGGSAEDQGDAAVAPPPEYRSDDSGGGDEGAYADEDSSGVPEEGGLDEASEGGYDESSLDDPGDELVGASDVMSVGRGGGGGGHGGGGHGGGGHGGHGGHHHGGGGRGGRGGRGWGYGGGWYGGPWYDGGWYDGGIELVEDDDLTAEEIAARVVHKLKAKSAVGKGGGGGGGGGHHHGGHHGHGGYGRGFWGGGPWWDVADGYDLLDAEPVLSDEALADRIAKKVAQKQWAANGHHIGYTAPETHWYTVAAPGAVKDEMDKIMREGETLDRDIVSTITSDPSFPSFHGAWGAFWTSFKKFYAENASGVGGWLSRTWSSTGDQVVSYGNQLNDWRARLRQFSGARVTEPTVTAIVRREDPTKFNYMPLVYGAIAIVALFGGGYALSKVSAVAALFGRKKAAA